MQLECNGIYDGSLVLLGWKWTQSIVRDGSEIAEPSEIFLWQQLGIRCSRFRRDKTHPFRAGSRNWSFNWRCTHKSFANKTPMNTGKLGNSTVRNRRFCCAPARRHRVGVFSTPVFHVGIQERNRRWRSNGDWLAILRLAHSFRHGLELPKIQLLQYSWHIPYPCDAGTHSKE